MEAEPSARSSNAENTSRSGAAYSRSTMRFTSSKGMGGTSERRRTSSSQ